MPWWSAGDFEKSILFISCIRIFWCHKNQLLSLFLICKNYTCSIHQGLTPSRHNALTWSAGYLEKTLLLMYQFNIFFWWNIALFSHFCVLHNCNTAVFLDFFLFFLQLIFSHVLLFSHVFSSLYDGLVAMAWYGVRWRRGGLRLIVSNCNNVFVLNRQMYLSKLLNLSVQIDNDDDLRWPGLDWVGG